MPEEPVKVEIESQPEPEPESNEIVVELKGKEAEKPEEIPPPRQERLPDWKSLQRTVAYQTRKLEEGMRRMNEVASLLQSQAQPQIPSSENGELDEIDQIASKDWKAAVRKLADEQAERKIQNYLTQEQEYQRQLSVKAQLEDSKKVLIEKFPNSFDETSEEAGLFRKVLNEDPSLIYNPRAYEIVAARMERILSEQGKITPTLKPTVEREAERRARVGVGSLPPSRAIPNSNRVVLTREQEAAAKSGNIPLESYARIVKQLETEQKLEVE